MAIWSDAREALQDRGVPDLVEAYGPVLGRMPTPRVQELVVERRAKWFAAYFGATWIATVLLLLDEAWLFRVAALCHDACHRRHRPGVRPDTTPGGRGRADAPSDGANAPYLLHSRI